ncbi:MAG: formyltransferase family protein [Betaproteobacteria bacterium]
MRDHRRLVVCGKGELACNALGYLADVLPLLGEPWALAAVPVAGDAGTDTWEPSLRALGTRMSLATVDSLDALALDACDLLFSLQYDRIIRSAQLGGARAYNLHFSALPRYRGCFPSMWPLRNGESSSGVTLHVLAAGIDDGDIVDQTVFPVPGFVSAFDLYRLYHAHGYELFKRNLEDIVEAREVRRPQDAAAATYYDRRSIDFSAIDIVDWHAMTVQACVNLIRSLIFEPYQLPRIDGRAIVAAEPVEWQRGAARQHDRFGRHSALLACRDGLVRVRFKP